jgi:formate hydrogenlyase subunit 4
MWFFLTRRLRTWLLLTILVPLVAGVLRRVGQTLEQRNGPSGLSNALLKGADLSDRARRGLRGRR